LGLRCCSRGLGCDRWTRGLFTQVHESNDLDVPNFGVSPHSQIPSTMKLTCYTSLRHQADTHNRSPSPRSPTAHHSRCAPPPHPTSSFACSAPPACDLPALVPALSSPLKLKRFFRDLGITGPPGEHLPYWDQISYTRELVVYMCMYHLSLHVCIMYHYMYHYILMHRLINI
jgi:hypothetical protein